jgi:glycosyltransferase involved in cell wall biosynthesis
MPARIGWEPTSRDFRVASARIRCLYPLRELQRRQVPVELYSDRSEDGYELVVVSKRYDPPILADAEKLHESGIRIVFDLCDNRFYAPTPEREKELKRLDRMMELADELVASTEALAEIMKARRPDKRITVIGDPVETEILEEKGHLETRWWHRLKCRSLLRKIAGARKVGRTPLVWFGHHGSGYADGGMGDLQRIRPILEKMNGRHRLSLTVISNSAAKFRELIAPWAVPTLYLAWHPLTFFTALKAHDVAVLPIEKTDFTRCKTNNRPATALASGLAVIADSIPSYEPLRFATVMDDWEAGLERYLRAGGDRAKDAAAGREFVVKEYSIDRIATDWNALFTRMLDDS